jgi:hypothetical protein
MLEHKQQRHGEQRYDSTTALPHKKSQWTTIVQGGAVDSNRRRH